MKNYAKKYEVITCPHCGREYLPAEIFVPRAFFGKPYSIDRYSDGKIDCFCGSSMNTYETYTCDNCDTTFKVRAKVFFNVEVDEKTNFNKEFVTKIFDQISMSEE